jgi:hypothetical protein
MRRTDRTDFARWETNLWECQIWDERNATIASHIRPTDIIWDFGAGNQILREMKPPGAHYVPIDCVAKTQDTVVCDFNSEFRLPPGRPTLVVMSGFLEYILDPDTFLTKLKVVSDTRIIFTWAYLPSNPDSRRSHGWISPLVIDHADPAYFRNFFADIRLLAIWSAQGIYEGRIRR